MGDNRRSETDVYRFLYNNIDTIPHLEALLQLWHSRPRKWVSRELAARLFVNESILKKIIRDLEQLQLAASTAEGEPLYWYASRSTETDELIDAVAKTYQLHLVEVTVAIHSKASSGAREFGRAFKLRKEGN